MSNWHADSQPSLPSLLSVKIYQCMFFIYMYIYSRVSHVFADRKQRASLRLGHAFSLSTFTSIQRRKKICRKTGYISKIYENSKVKNGEEFNIQSMFATYRQGPVYKTHFPWWFDMKSLSLSQTDQKVVSLKW